MNSLSSLSVGFKRVAVTYSCDYVYDKVLKTLLRIIVELHKHVYQGRLQTLHCLNDWNKCLTFNATIVCHLYIVISLKFV